MAKRIDIYLRLVMTVIAISLAVIAYKLPVQNVEASFISGGPTRGDFSQKGLTQEKRKELYDNIPVVWVLNKKFAVEIDQ